jgi:glutamate dehydrogenase
MLMTTGSQERKAEIIESVAERVREHLDPTVAGAPELFVRQFYAHVPIGDLKHDTPDNLYGSALSLWALAQQRAPKKPNIRVYTPRAEADGWASPHSVVEIVTDDMPFLLESITAYLNQNQAEVHLVIHPILEVQRDTKGQLTALHADFENRPGSHRESFMHIQVVEQPAEAREALSTGIARILVDVRAAVEDFPAMNARCAEITASLETGNVERDEEVAFLQWLLADHFTFLGFRSYTFEGDRALVDGASGLGVLRDDLASAFQGLLTGGFRPVETQHVDALRVTKANRHSTVHRPVLLDTIGIQRKDEDGRVTGEHLFIGLFTSRSYEQAPQEIPILRRKVQYVLDHTDFHKDSYNYKTLAYILRTYPRDELWQVTAAELHDISLGILHLQERQQIAFFPRRDPFCRFVSCLVYVPRERYDTALRLRFQEILEKAYDGTIASYFTQMSDAAHARLHLIVKTNPQNAPKEEPDAGRIQDLLIEAGRSWGDCLRDALVQERGEQAGMTAYRTFAGAFSSSYRDNSNAAVAVYDIECLERAMGGDGFALHLYRPLEAEENELRFKLYVSGKPAALSDVLPVLENMGLKVLREVPYKISPKDAPVAWVRDFELVSRSGEAIDLDEVREGFHEAIALVWAGLMEDDGFNQLVLSAGLTARQVVILRTYCKYLRQAGTPFSQEYIEQTLGANPDIVRWLVDLFELRFDPSLNGDRDVHAAQIVSRIEPPSRESRTSMTTASCARI